MSSRLVARCLERIVSLLLILHCAAWLMTVLAWMLAWRDNAAPVGPRYNFAKDYISWIDLGVYCNASRMAQTISLRLTPWAPIDLNSLQAVLLAALVFILGSLQWFLAALLVDWLRRKRGPIYANSFAGALLLWFLGTTLVWILE